MEPSDDNRPVRMDQQKGPQSSATQSVEGIPVITSYANTVVNPKGSTTTPIHQEQEAVIARRTTQSGIPLVIFKTMEYFGVISAEYRRTIVGRFLKIRPQIEKVRSRLLERFLLKGLVKIRVFDNYNVFLDFTNDEDFNMVWYKRAVEI